MGGLGQVNTKLGKKYSKATWFVFKLGKKCSNDCMILHGLAINCKPYFFIFVTIFLISFSYERLWKENY